MRARDAAGLGVLAAVLGALVVIAGGATTYSLWADNSSHATQPVHSGNLDLALTGEAPRWRVTSVDEDERTISNPSEFRAMPGDTFTITQDLATTLQGDNIAGDLTVRWADPQAAELPDGVIATYTVRADDGAPDTPDTRLGMSVTVPKLPPGEATWTVTITLTFGPEAAPQYVDPAAAEGEPALVELGEIIVELGQVRPAREDGP